jgi:Flp pilus assembly protein TadG
MTSFRSIRVKVPGKAALRRLLPGGARAFDEKGTAAVEFAIIAPVMLAIMLASFQFSLAFYNYVSVGNAVAVGVRTFAMSRSTSTTSTPYTTTVATMRAALPTSMTGTSLTVTLSVAGTACATDAACRTALVAGAQATVAASYPCSLQTYGVDGLLHLISVDYKPSCTLTGSTVGRVE